VTADTRERLAGALRPDEATALAAWAALVDADAEQVARVREPEPPRDHYAPTAERFRPGALSSAELPLLQALARPTDTWLDIGAGGGRFAVPLAAHVARVVAVEPSGAMRSTLATAAAEAGRTNIEVHDLRWPAAGWTQDADVSLAAHCLYDIREAGPFLDAMEAHTRRLCVAVFRQFARGTQLARLFEAVHGEPLHTLPALREFVALLSARGRRVDLRTVPDDAPTVVPRDRAFRETRRLLWLAEGSAKDAHMQELVQQWWTSPEGGTDSIVLPVASRFIGVVTWEPPRA
jgi:SAM-dependent methyltransferase